MIIIWFRFQRLLGPLLLEQYPHIVARLVSHLVDDEAAFQCFCQDDWTIGQLAISVRVRLLLRIRSKYMIHMVQMPLTEECRLPHGIHQPSTDQHAEFLTATAASF
jgi:hypothetical protein